MIFAACAMAQSQTTPAEWRELAQSANEAWQFGPIDMNPDNDPAQRTHHDLACSRVPDRAWLPWVS